MEPNNRVLTTPIWVLGLRIAQVVLSIVVLGMCAALTSGAAWGFLNVDEGAALGIAAAVFTWVIVAYIVLAEKLAPLRIVYHIVAVLVLDLYMIIIWLCTWALNADSAAGFAKKERFFGGSGGGSSGGDDCLFGPCIDLDDFDFTKRSLERRKIYSYNTYKGLLGGSAGIGALVWLLFIATFAWTILNFLKGRKEGRFPLNPMSKNTNPGHVEEAKVAPTQQQPMQPQYTGQEQQYQQQPMQPQYTGQEQQYQQQPVQPQYTGQEQQYQQQPVQPQHTGQEQQYEQPPIPAAYTNPDGTQAPHPQQQH